MAHRVAPRAEADLDEIWLHIAKNSGTLDVANRLIDSITDRFLLLARHPHLGRARDNDLGEGLRTFPLGEFIIVYSVEGSDVSILRVVHGRRDLERIFGQ